MHPGAFCIANAQTLRLQLRSWTNCNLTDQLKLDANQLQLNANQLQLDPAELQLGANKLQQRD
jgi:hypothetical protein